MLALAGDVIFLRDEWSVALDRRGLSAGVLLDPFVGHLAVALIATYKLLLATFGMSSSYPFHVTSTLMYLLAAVLLFVYARRRVGDWLALMATCLILFFGAAAVDMLSPFQMFFSGAIAAGLGALVALDRDDRTGDVIACGLLAVSIAFGEAGLAFAVGILVRLALSRRPLRPRLYVVLVPLILYALWWLGWGHTAESHVTLHNIATAPIYVLDAASAAIASLTGIANASDALPEPVGQQWLPAAFIAAIALAAWRVRRLGRVPPGVWPVLAIGVTFWALAGFNQFFGRAPGNGRYLYPSAVFVLLIAVELLRGVRPGWRGICAAATVTVVRSGGQSGLPRRRLSRLLQACQRAATGGDNRARHRRPRQPRLRPQRRYQPGDLLRHLHDPLPVGCRRLRLPRLHRRRAGLGPGELPRPRPTGCSQRSSASSSSPAAPPPGPAEPYEPPPASRPALELGPGEVTLEAGGRQPRPR